MPKFVRAAALLALLLPAAAFSSSYDDLKRTRQQLEQARAREAALSEETAQLEQELASLRREAVEMAAALQKNEAELTASEEKLRILAAQEEEKAQALEKRKKDLGAMVETALRLSAAPPDALLMMQGDFEETMRASRVLGMMAQSVRKEAESLHEQLNELALLTQKVQEQRERQMKAQAQTELGRATLMATIAKRQELYAKLGSERDAVDRKARRLAKKADDLKDLVASLEKAEREEDARKSRAAQKKTGRTLAKVKGRMRTPAAGKIVRRFGESAGRNETSKGITIRTRENAQVTAPFDGEVVFTGPFLTYGKLVILRHGGDFHTLLAGLSKIGVSAGEFLLEGEPIGAMGDGDAAADLYLELRERNQPVDPAPWIAGTKGER